MPQSCAEFEQPFVVIGHRGASGHEPENTLRSFARAVDMGAHAIELDVFLLEGELLVIHDDSLERTTNGVGRLATHALSEVRSLDAGAGDPIPLLSEVLAAIGGAAGINVELKGEGTGARLVSYLDEHQSSAAGILVSSFHHAELTGYREAGGSHPLGLLFGRSADGLFERADALDPYSIHLSVRLASPALVDRIHERDLRVFVYTVNELDVLRRLQAAGVDGVFSDYPDRILSALDSRTS